METKSEMIPRFMIAAPHSGSGKTSLTCGLLRLLQRRGLDIASFKCGPDYIDPMFHSKVIGTRSRNLDTFFTGEDGIFRDGDQGRKVDHIAVVFRYDRETVVFPEREVCVFRSGLRGRPRFRHRGNERPQQIFIEGNVRAERPHIAPSEEASGPRE